MAAARRACSTTGGTLGGNRIREIKSPARQTAGHRLDRLLADGTLAVEAAPRDPLGARLLAKLLADALD
ncbi:MAG: hypothetical protein H8E44_46385 [Planctomycetes bacterium]|nr:hypothetical protein [Planctomycetota bacterium]